MLQNENIIFLTSAPFESYMVRRPHHIGKRLAERNRVINISSRPWTGYQEKSKHGPWESRLFTRLPFTRLGFVQKINRVLYRRYVKQVIKSLNPPPIIFVYGVPNMDLYENLPRKLLVYELTDDIPASHKDDHSKMLVMQSDVEKMLRIADVVFVVSEELYKKASKINSNTYLIRNGVDFEYFAKAWQEEGNIPQELKDIKKPIVGYCGAVSPWVDFNSIRETALKLPEVNFVLIGRIDQRCQKIVDGLREMKNISILGEKPYEMLVNYIRCFDIAIILFIVDEFTVSINPIKLYEYLAAGKPVISTPIPEAKRYAEEGVLSVADNSEGWRESVVKMLQFSKEYKYIERRMEIAKMNSWDSRVEEIKQILGGFLKYG